MKRWTVYAAVALALLPSGCGDRLDPVVQRPATAGSSVQPNLLLVASYVTDRATNTVDVFRHTATGDVAPVYRITGANTGLSSPTADAFDGAAQLYVLNASSFCVFAGGSRGNVTPKYEVSGGLTQLSNPVGLAVDSSGTTYVTNLGSGGQPYIGVYAPGSNGNRAPERTIYDAQNFFFIPAGIAVFGSTLYVADPGDQTVNEYPASSNGLVNPTAVITGLNTPEGVAVDSGGHIYVTDSDSVIVFAANANGSAKPIRKITGSNTLLNGPLGIEVGHKEIDVANSGGSSLLVYPQTGNGNIAPSRAIAGSTTGLVSPQSVAVH